MRYRRGIAAAAIAALAAGAVVVALAGCPASGNPHNAQLEFTQLDVNLNGDETKDSAWGSLALSYMGSNQVLYFNLVINGAHVLENIPLLSNEGAGVEHTAILPFDLGVADGTDVSEMMYAFGLSDTPAAAPPTNTRTAAVGDESTIFYDGIFDVLPKEQPPAPPARIQGGTATGAEFHGVRFPNQDCGLNECCPAAVSNSLKFLKQRHNLDLNDEDISIGAMKEATGWNNGCDDTWYDKKDQVMKDKGIVTRRIDNIEEVFQEIKDGHDVELIMQGHAVVITGLVRLENNAGYFVQMIDDIRQGEPGGTVGVQYFKYDPATGRLEGEPWVNFRKFKYCVSESPAEN